MQLTLFNGSPRGTKSNTALLLDHFVLGVSEHGDHQIETARLVKTKDVEKHVALFQKAENVILAFPLYTDAMPGIVKHFIEALEPLCGRDDNPAIGFIVQSGFPEPAHSRFVQRYLEKLARRLNGDYLGTVVRGGVEGIQIMPPLMTRKLFTTFRRLGRHFAQHRAFDGRLLKKLARRERMSPLRIWIYRQLQKTGMANMYWDQQLKSNGAFDRRFDRPFA